MLRNKSRDVGTLSTLCKEAERLARARGSEAPGSEHFVLACLGLEDGTARRALASLGASPEGFADAIRVQFEQALGHAGIATPPDGDLGAPTTSGMSNVYKAAASGQALVQRLAAAAPGRQPRALLSADVLLAAAQEQFSIAARALRVLGITPEQLVEAASAEVAQHGQARASQP